MNVKKSKLIAFALFLSFMLFGGTLPVALAADAISPLPHLGIYYGWPSLVNGAAGNVTTATATFNQFDVLVFGDGIEHSAHGDNTKTKTIITNLNASGKKVFGYVDLGVSTQNLSVATMKTYVDEWKSMGAYGIFLDDYGFDYGVTRARQNTMLTYIHSVGLKAFMNSWNIDHALGNLDESGASNPPSTVAGDYYLAESWLISGNSYQSVSSWSAKADKALGYYRTKGVITAALATNAANGATASDNTTDKFKMAWWGSAMYGFPFQWTDLWYSASNNTLYYYSNLSTNYGTTFPADPVHQSSSTLNSRASNTGTINVNGNGSSTGTGSFTASASITIDGSTSDWSAISALNSSGSGTVSTIKATNNGSNLYLLIQGSGLNVKNQFYLNTDNSTTSGYNPTGWATSGADDLLENGSLYTYAGTNNSFTWTPSLTLSSAQFVNNGSAIEVSIPLSTLGLNAGNTIRLGFIKNDSATDRLPASSGTLYSYTLQ